MSGFVLRLAEGHALPVLALVLAEVQHLEGLAVLDAEQPLAGDVDRPAAEVATDPAAAELLGDGESRARAAEEVGDEVTLIGRGLDDALQECLRFLGIVA